MKVAEIRSKFLSYFEKNGHTVVESSSLIPHNDPTLLFTNAGMNQFKDVFTGKEKRPYTRATTAQKVVRAGGKHNDLENVGFTARHHTFFEMLGNFSFGDYFKKDAIRFAWEFVTKELKMPKDRLYVTVFENDDEAADIWHKQEGIPKDRIFRFGMKDNFWSMGDTGPCGPCTEIFFDRGEKYGKEDPHEGIAGGGDRYVEFWNLVFMQFDRDENGKLNPLPKPSVDTGAGLERIGMLLQEVDTNYDTDIFLDVIQRTAKLCGKIYDKKSELAFSFRVIADHARATTFLIGDGVLPSNEGRGYVLRRIMRRAIRHGRKLGIEGPFMDQVCGFVIDQMKGAYPYLVDQKAFIQKAVRAEEEQFLRTLDRGLALLDEEVARLGAEKTLPGEAAFKLYDTYGFPIDLTRVICAEKGIAVDESGFEKAMERQKAESRKHWKGSGEQAIADIYHEIAEELRGQGAMPRFLGYEELQTTSKCLALVAPAGDALKRVDLYATPSSHTSEGPLVQAIFTDTPFYGESGGQVGDRGRVSGDGFEGQVVDVQKPVGDLIVAHIRPLKGALKVGGTYTQTTDAQLRAYTAKNHTATHLLHWALREVLGKHVKQAGSLVTPDLLRFDFTHFQAMTPDELKRVEELINEKIWLSEVVSKREMSKDEATAAGAIAFFGEKYGERVRVVSVGGYSVELCGGTHVDNSAEIHLFKIASESGIAAGVRRIIAYTSKGAYAYLSSQDEKLKALRDQIRASSVDELPDRIAKLMDSERALKKEIEKLHAAQAGQEVDTILASAKSVGGTILVAAVCEPNSQGVKHIREIADQLKQKRPEAVVVLGISEPESGKAYLLAAKGPKAPASVHAGQIIQKLASHIDGRGGGKPDSAQAGGTKPAGLPAAIAAAESSLS